MKRSILFLFCVFFNISIANGQKANIPSITETILTTSEVEDEGDFVSQHEDIKLTLGTLEFPAKFLYKEELVPHQGYLIKFKDFIRVEKLFKNMNKGCDILYDELLKECKRDLTQCQDACNERVKKLLEEKDSLKISLELQIKKTEDEVTNKYIWTSAGLVVGAGVGILINELSK